MRHRLAEEWEYHFRLLVDLVVVLVEAVVVLVEAVVVLVEAVVVLVEAVVEAVADLVVVLVEAVADLVEGVRVPGQVEAPGRAAVLEELAVDPEEVDPNNDLDLGEKEQGVENQLIINNRQLVL